MKKEYRFSLPLLLIFTLVSVFLIVGSAIIKSLGADKNVLLLANFLFLLISLLVFQLQKKALANKNPNVFIRSIMGGMLIKMFSIILLLVIYWQISGPDFSKSTVIFSVVLYLVYFITGVYATMKLNKSKHA